VATAARLCSAALAAAIAAVGYGFYRRDLAAAHARLAGASDVVTTPCGPIEYASTGSGPPVLFVHGAGGISIKASRSAALAGRVIA
jgi:hypothetical protein